MRRTKLPMHKIHPLKYDDENRKSKELRRSCDICTQNVEQNKTYGMTYNMKNIETFQVISFLICDDCVDDSVLIINEKNFTITINTTHHFGGVWKILDIA